MSPLDEPTPGATPEGAEPEHDQTLALVERARAGDAAAIEGLLARHLPALRAYVRARLSPALRVRESTSDIVQSACRDVLTDLERFRYQGEEGFRAWLFATAHRKIADKAEHWGAQKRDAGREAAAEAELLAVYGSFCSPSQQAMGREALQLVERAMERLPAADREIIVLARIVGLSHEEIGRRLGLSEAGSRSRLFRALAELSEVLRADMAGS
ncbi:MAG: sigma-70 family RNA polymerase sigma factor [Planctomycetota bacterium]